MGSLCPDCQSSRPDWLTYAEVVSYTAKSAFFSTLSAIKLKRGEIERVRSSTAHYSCRRHVQIET